MNMPARYPERIVCLTEETTETLYLLGEERRIVGISGYTVRPPQARRDKPRVSAFLSAKTDKRSEEHTSELQSRLHLVCRLLLEKKKTRDVHIYHHPSPYPRTAGSKH